MAADHTEASFASPASSPPDPGAPAALAPRRWQALAVISVSQLMISVDSTIVNIALPSAQRNLFLTALHPGSPYWSIIMPAAAIFGLGLGIAFTPAMHLATHNVKASDTGIASGLINASQQIGGAIGAALLNTIAATAARWLHAYPQTAGRLSAATVHGYAIGARWSTGILILAALIAFTMVNTSSATRFRGPAVTSCADSAADKRRSI